MSIKDAKSKQLLEKVAHAFNIEPLAMESLAAEQQLGPILQNFLSINGAPCILFTYDAQASEPLGVYTELADMPQDTTQDFFYLIRNKQGAIGQIEVDLIQGMMNSDYLSSFVIMLQQVFIPTLEKLNYQAKVSEEQVQNFLGICRRFVDTLQKCSLIVKDKVDLIIPDNESVSQIPTILNQQ